VTVVHPILQMCHALDDTHLRNEEDFDVLLSFIEESFSRFMSMPYSVFDEAAALVREKSVVEILSCITVTFVHQYKYKREVSVDYSSQIMEWLCHLFLRLILIGESPDAISHLMDRIETDNKPAQEGIFRWANLIHNWTPSSDPQEAEQTRPLPGDGYLLNDVFTLTC